MVLEEAEEFEALPGNGLKASYNKKELLGGSMKFMQEQIGISEENAETGTAFLQKEGKNTAVLCKKSRNCLV